MDFGRIGYALHNDPPRTIRFRHSIYGNCIGIVMLVLRVEQMRAIARRLNSDFRRRAYGHLWRIFPQDCQRLGDCGVRDRVEDGIRRAAGFGMTTERQALCFIDMMFLIGPDFYRQNPEAQDVLECEEMSGDCKLDELYRIADACSDQ